MLHGKIEEKYILNIRFCKLFQNSLIIISTNPLTNISSILSLHILKNQIASANSGT